MIEGTWPKDDLRRAFVAGAKWHEYHSTGFTMWQSDVKVVERQAENRYALLTSQSSQLIFQCKKCKRPFEVTKFFCPECEWLSIQKFAEMMEKEMRKPPPA